MPRFHPFWLGELRSHLHLSTVSSQHFSFFAMQSYFWLLVMAEMLQVSEANVLIS